MDEIKFSTVTQYLAQNTHRLNFSVNMRLKINEFTGLEFMIVIMESLLLLLLYKIDINLQHLHIYS